VSWNRWNRWILLSAQGKTRNRAVKPTFMYVVCLWILVETYTDSLLVLLRSSFWGSRGWREVDGFCYMKEFLYVVLSLRHRFLWGWETRKKTGLHCWCFGVIPANVFSKYTHTQVPDTEKYKSVRSDGGFFISRRAHFVIMEDLVGKVYPMQRYNSSSPKHLSLVTDI
jgi:hypothetical protein